ncbi:MAG TPA: hypothetical protein VFB16_05915 [Bauldia sp.]|nr:hypothetical protein [Bauldia sp.]
MRMTAMTLAACLAILSASGAPAAARNAGGPAGNAAVISGGVLATGGGAGLNGANQAVPVSGAGYSALTAAECKGLGGKVVASTACSLNGGTDACVTVDRDGVVRRVCLSK